MNREYIKRVGLAKDYISENIGEELTLDHIAKAAHFSKYHFHRVFKAVTDETVSGYIRRMRLEKAANQILADNERPITTIAMDCGYGSSQNFATAFKNHFGTSPTEFRETNLQDENNRFRISKKNKGVVSELKKNDNTTAINTEAMKVEVRKMPSYNVACVSQTGPYGPDSSEKGFEALYAWASQKDFSDASVYLGIIWDNPEVTEPEKCRYDACMTVPEGVTPEGDVTIKTIDGGLYAVCYCDVPDYESLEKVYADFFMKWISSSNYLPGDAVSYEIYLNDPSTHPEKHWLINICVPVEPIS